MVVGLNKQFSKKNHPLFVDSQLSILGNVLNIIPTFDFTIYTYDNHAGTDGEFNHLPGHCSSPFDAGEFSTIVKKIERSGLTWQKNTSSPFSNPHYRKLIQNMAPKEIAVCGILASFDVLHTCFDLIDLKQKISIIPDCIGDTTEETKQCALRILNWYNIKPSK